MRQISSVENGKLYPRSHRPSSNDAGHCRLQYRKNGRNVSRDVTAAEVAALPEALARYQRARELSEQYLDRIVADTPPLSPSGGG